MSDELEPDQGEEWVKRQFWKCNVIGHRHRERRSAAACIMRRKGEAGELKKLERNIAILEGLRKGVSFGELANKHNCSDSNIIKAANSCLTKAWRMANKQNSIPYKCKTWKREEFVDPTRKAELDCLMEILRETEVKLRELV